MTDTPSKSLEEQIWDALRTCYDPEISVDIVELGLIYKCEITGLADGSKKVRIEMTLTSPGCSMADVICDQVRAKIRHLPGVGEAQIDLVFDPPWDASKISEAARLKLGLL